MLEEICRDKKKKYIVMLLLIGSFLAALKCIFVSLQMDEEYAVSMSYRLLLGDRLFTQIWDPHQTSAFDVDLSEIVSYDDIYCDLGAVGRRADPAGNSLLSLQDALLFAGA